MENLIAKAIFVALAIAAGWEVLSPAADATGGQIEQIKHADCQQAAGWEGELAKSGLSHGCK